MAFFVRMFAGLSQATSISGDVEESPERNMKMQPISNGFLFLRMFIFAVAVPYLLRLKLPQVAAVLTPRRDSSPVDADRVNKIAAYVERAIRRGRPLVRPGCLTRGLTRYYFFRRAGMDVSLRFGMGKIDGTFVGHCWLVKDGEPFMEKEDPRPRYIEMYRISKEGGGERTPIGTAESLRLPNS
jgi:hypothetical protein